MFKGPKSADEVLPRLLKDLTEVFGPDLVSVTLYGSAAGSEYRPGLSDLNLMVVVTDNGLAALARLAPVHQSWRKHNVAQPLVLTAAEIDRSIDSFPLEFLNIKLRHKTVHGPDPLADLLIDPADLRLQCEREFKGKLFLLREALIGSGGREAELKDVALASIKSFAAIFRGVLHLMGEDPSTLTSAQVLDRAARRLGLDEAVLARVWSLRDQKKPPRGEVRKLFGPYLALVAQAATLIDQWTPAQAAGSPTEE